jgi:hypothetical protein
MGRNHLKDLQAEERIMLKWILEKIGYEDVK